MSELEEQNRNPFEMGIECRSGYVTIRKAKQGHFEERLRDL